MEGGRKKVYVSSSAIHSRYLTIDPTDPFHIKSAISFSQTQSIHFPDKILRPSLPPSLPPSLLTCKK